MWRDMSDNMDLSGAIEQLQSMLSTENGQNDLKALVSQFTGGADTENSASEQENSGNSGGGFDFSNPETMMKIQALMSSMQSQTNSSDAQFLNSLRPYLRESRRSKLDQAIKLLSMAKAFQLLQGTNGEGGLL